MLSVILSIAAAGASPIDAERAYAAMAQTRGQWTAFRATAAPDALMFVPDPRPAGAWLAGRKDPPVAVIWWPARGWMSCDGQLGVNFGPWIRAGGKRTGTFTTVWRKSGAGWQWTLDRGDETAHPIAAADRPRIERASCSNLAGVKRAARPDIADPDAMISAGDGLPSPTLPKGVASGGPVVGSGASPDRSLAWEARGLEGDPTGHILRVWRWTGSGYRLALLQTTRSDAAR
jgi:hypothetical protein